MKNSRQKGFTLIELLIAVPIFAMIAILCYQSINQTITVKQANDVRVESLSRLNHVFTLMSRDLVQIVNRPVRDEAGLVISGIHNALGGTDMELTRQGRIIDIQPVATTLQRVRYRLTDNHLYRDHWAVLDRVADSTAESRLLADGITAIQYEFIDIDAQTYPHWPYFNTGIGSDVSYLPAGVRITLETEQLGTITRTFMVGGA